MRLRKSVPLALVAAMTLVLGTAGATNAAKTVKFAGAPIVIGAAIDTTKGMAPFDAPALAAAQIEIAKINAAGGVDGHQLQLKYLNDQLDPTQTKADALKLIGEGVNIGWVTCDVDYATPAIHVFLQAKLLTVAPCIGTDEMGPSRFGAPGQLAFSFGNAAQDEGAAAAEYAYSRGWHTAVVVTDNLLRYFQDVCKAFTDRFTQLGGKIVAQESFTQGDKTINNVVSRVNGEKSDAIAFCTSFGGDQPAFVSGLRSLKNNTPIINGWASDGTYWWPTNPKVTNFYFLTYAGAVARDPDPAVRAFEAKLKAAGHPAQTGRLHHRRRRDRRDRLRDQAERRLDGRREARRHAVEADEVQDARRPDQLHAGAPQRLRPSVPGGRGQQQRGKGADHSHRQGCCKDSLGECNRDTPTARLASGRRRLAVVRGHPGARGRRSRAALGRDRRPDRAERRRQDDARQHPDRLRPAVGRADRARRDRHHALAAASAGPRRPGADVPARAALSRADGARERRRRGARGRRVVGRGPAARR